MISEPKYMKVRVNLIKETLSNAEMKIEYVSTEHMVADLFTKPLVGAFFCRHIVNLKFVYDKETLLKLYETAVNDKPYSFLNVKLDAADRRDMFWLRWEARLLPEDPSLEESDDDVPVRNRG